MGVGGVQVARVSEEVCVWLCAVWVSLFAWGFRMASLAFQDLSCSVSWQGWLTTDGYPWQRLWAFWHTLDGKQQ